MSNEYKDWEQDKIEEEQVLIEKYPFLRARDIDGTPDLFMKFPMINLEIPDGWYRLFFQMCDDLKNILITENKLDNFYFIQIKEKYNELVCYTNEVTSQEVEQLLKKYKNIFRFLCCKCGKPAIYETEGYFTSFCRDCFQKYSNSHNTKKLYFNSGYEITGLKNGIASKRTVGFKNEWDRYMKEINYEKS